MTAAVYTDHCHGCGATRVYTYRGHHIMRDPPPIPSQAFDWAWWIEGYDGPGDTRHGAAESLEAAMREIDEMIEEETA